MKKIIFLICAVLHIYQNSQAAWTQAAWSKAFDQRFYNRLHTDYILYVKGLENYFFESVHQNSLSGVRKALQLGVDVNAVDNDGLTALMYAAGYNHKDIAKLLIGYRAQVNAVGNEGWTALMLACLWGNKEIVKLLIQNGADVNAANNQGQTALMFACLSNKEETVKLLLQRGADVNVVNNAGKTAFAYALSNTQLVKILLQAGGGIAFTKYSPEIFNSYGPKVFAEADALITQWNDYKGSRAKALRSVFKQKQQLPLAVIDEEIAKYVYQPIPTITEQIQDLRIKALQKLGRGFLKRKQLAEAEVAIA